MNYVKKVEKGFRGLDRLDSLYNLPRSKFVLLQTVKNIRKITNE